ncbi:MAG: hypothetical protein Q4G58_11360 [bacterium]|nr:hypothetical protein [bacterium]
MEPLEQTKNTYSAKTTLSLLTYMMVHFGVDFACFYYLMGTFSLYKYIGMGPTEGFLLYNTLAFGLQLLIGRFFEHRSYRIAGLIGVLLVMTGLGINLALPMICKDSLVLEYQIICGIPFAYWKIIILVIMAVGNAFFHVAGGIDSLYYGNGKSKRCGLFVAPGALGVSMGAYTGENLIMDEVPILCGLLLGFVLIFTYGDGGQEPAEKNKFQSYKESVNKIGASNRLPAVLPCICFVAIILRSYIGPFQKVSLTVLFLTALCTVFGKVMGGVLADGFGDKAVGGISLIISAICFTGIWSHPLPTIIGIVSFNMAMPITLYGLYQYFPENPGTVFGLNSFALLIGYGLYSGGIWLGTYTVVAGSILAAVFIVISVPRRKKEKTKRITARGELNGANT